MSIYLVMELGGTVLYREEVCYDGLLTAGEKMQLQERMALDMMRRYARDICRAMIPPKFYVAGVMSRGNRQCTDDINDGAEREVPGNQLFYE